MLENLYEVYLQCREFFPALLMESRKGSATACAHSGKSHVLGLAASAPLCLPDAQLRHPGKA